MHNFPNCPTPDNMKRKDRMDRLYDRLKDTGLYVQPVCLDDRHSEWGYFIVSVDDPFNAASK
jgi:hypothetical protein